MSAGDEEGALGAADAGDWEAPAGEREAATGEWEAAAGAGWHPDPFDLADERWWDGSRWTTHVREALPEESEAGEWDGDEGSAGPFGGQPPGWYPWGGEVARWWDGEKWGPARRPSVDGLRRPSVDRPGRPSVDSLRRPSVDRPGRPSVDSPGRPSVDRPGRPSVDGRGRPSVDRPGRPSERWSGRTRARLGYAGVMVLVLIGVVALLARGGASGSNGYQVRIGKLCTRTFAVERSEIMKEGTAAVAGRRSHSQAVFVGELLRSLARDNAAFDAQLEAITPPPQLQAAQQRYLRIERQDSAIYALVIPRVEGEAGLPALTTVTGLLSKNAQKLQRLLIQLGGEACSTSPLGLG